MKERLIEWMRLHKTDNRPCYKFKGGLTVQDAATKLSHMTGKKITIHQIKNYVSGRTKIPDYILQAIGNVCECPKCGGTGYVSK